METFLTSMSASEGTAGPPLNVTAKGCQVGMTLIDVHAEEFILEEEEEYLASLPSEFHEDHEDLLFEEFLDTFDKPPSSKERKGQVNGNTSNLDKYN